MTFPGGRPALARGKNLWWQPQPGLLVQLSGDGTAGPIWTPEQLLPAEPYGRDGALLHLLGADASGRLWFDLAAPAPVPAPAASPEAATADP